jgi:phosphopantothenoylcysteine decarboxylase/phosphopantothenate--cysteine ligase
LPPTIPTHFGLGRTLLITAGPTHEPIDAVRFIGNRSSGKMGLALADAALRRHWTVRLLFGPASAAHELPRLQADHPSHLHVHRFRTCEDLRSLLATHAPSADCLVMAAAVADYRPKVDPAFLGGKFRRTDQKLTLDLEPTPDLLAEVAANRRPSQFMVGFALEPRDELLASARAKLARKKIDMVIGNPLETMDSETVEAIVIDAAGATLSTSGRVAKADFAPWVLSLIESHAQSHAAAATRGA